VTGHPPHREADAPTPTVLAAWGPTAAMLLGVLLLSLFAWQQRGRMEAKAWRGAAQMRLVAVHESILERMRTAASAAPPDTLDHLVEDGVFLLPDLPPERTITLPADASGWDALGHLAINLDAYETVDPATANPIIGFTISSPHEPGARATLHRDGGVAWIEDTMTRRSDADAVRRAAGLDPIPVPVPSPTGG